MLFWRYPLILLLALIASFAMAFLTGCPDSTNQISAASIQDGLSGGQVAWRALSKEQIHLLNGWIGEGLKQWEECLFTPKQLDDLAIKVRYLDGSVGTLALLRTPNSSTTMVMMHHIGATPSDPTCAVQTFSKDGITALRELMAPSRIDASTLARSN